MCLLEIFFITTAFKLPQIPITVIFSGKDYIKKIPYKSYMYRKTCFIPTFKSP